MHVCRRFRSAALLAAAMFSVHPRLAAQAYTFTQFTGAALNGGSFGVQGLIAQRLAFDAAGNIYLDDVNNNTVRQLTPDGKMSLFAGMVMNADPYNLNGVDGVGFAAHFVHPCIVGFDQRGNLLVYDGGSGSLRQIAPNRLVTTTASLGGGGYSTSPLTAMDSAGNIYLTDYYSPQVRKVAPNGAVSVLVPPGQSGGWAALGIAADDSGNVYVSLVDGTIRRAVNGTLELWAGRAQQKGATDGPRLSALFNAPASLVTDRDGNLYVADYDNATIRKISVDGTVSTLAGLAGSRGTDDGAGSAARLGGPRAISLSPSGQIYFIDQGNNSIRTVSPAGVVHTVVRNLNVADGPLATAFFSFPLHLASDSDGNLFATEHGRIRKVSSDGWVSTFAGVANETGPVIALPPDQTIPSGAGVCSDGAGGVYVADYGQHAIKHVSSTGAVTTFAGLINVSGSANGVGTAAQFNRPSGVARDPNGNLYVADAGNFAIRKITPDGTVSLFAGLMGVSGAADGIGTSALFASITGIAVDASGNVYVADNSAIRKITPAGAVSTLAGVLGTGGSADGTGAAARFGGTNYFFHGIADIAVDSAGSIFVADYGNYTIRKVTPTGVVTTIGGMAGSSASASGTGSGARFQGPSGIAVDGDGNVYVTQNSSGDDTIRKGVPTNSAPTFTVTPTSLTAASGSTLVLTASASAAETMQWYRNGTAISGATNATYSIAKVAGANTGTFTVVATNAVGSTTSAAANVVAVSPAKPGRFINVSVLAPASADELLTVGFVTGGAGTSGKQSLLVRGIGPALANFGVGDFQPDPNLKLIAQADSSVVAANDNWGGDSAVGAANAAFTGLPLTNAASTDAATVVTVPGAGYSVQLSGSGHQSGRVLAEVYDATASYSPTTPRLINVSTRAKIAVGGTLTIGFVIDGETARTVLIRVTGPALSSFGIADFMPDPQLAVFRNSTPLYQNAAWGGDALIKATAAAVGAFPIADINSHDAAWVITLPPGLYSVQATSTSGSPGEAIIEAYEVP